jgi:type I restriction enzyme S subunit
VNSRSLGTLCVKIGSGATPRGGKDVYTESGEIALIRSQNVYNDRFSREGLAYLRPEHAEQLSNVEVHPGDVLLNITGDSVARVCQVPHDVLPARVNQHVAIIRPDPAQLDPRFLRFFLAGPQMQDQMLGLAAAGATRNALTKGMIERFQLPAIPITEQREISGILGGLEDKIDLNWRMNETLDAMAQAIFQDWFIDFGPVRAKMEGKPSWLTPDVATVFPDSVDNDGKPRGWRSGQLSEVAEVAMGASPSSDTYNILQIGAPLVNGPVEFGDFFVKKAKWTTKPTQMSRLGDLIMCVRGSTTGRYAHADGDYCLGRGVCAIRARDGIQEFVNRNIIDRMPELLAKTTGSVFPNLSSNDIKAFPIYIPPRPVLQAFCDFTTPFRDRIWSNVRENTTLASLRDLLLPKLISGEVCLKDADKVLAEVA